MLLEQQVRLHLDIWIRALERYLDQVRSTGDPRHVDIERLASNWEASGANVEADWLRYHTGAANLEQTIANVTLHIALGEIGEAFSLHRRFEETRWHIAALLDQPDIIRGRKVSHRVPGATRPGRRKGKNHNRNVEMAREFLAWQNSPRRSAMSETTKKEEIGRRYGLGRSASIAAINDGLKKVSGISV